MKRKLSNVLLIDDDEPTNFINRYIIDEANCAESIMAVQSAEEGLNYLSHCITNSSQTMPTPDLIFLDINMPGLSGWDFLEEYKKFPDFQKKKPIIVMLTTSLNPDDQRRAGTIEEVSEFRSKNLTHQMLEDLLKEYFPECA